MRKTVLSYLFLLTAALGAAGCVMTPTERNAVGQTYQFTEPGCIVRFNDGTESLFGWKCVRIIGMGPLSYFDVPEGTCIALGEPRFNDSLLNPILSYDVTIGDLATHVLAESLPLDKPVLGIARSQCAPTRVTPSGSWREHDGKYLRAPN